MSSSTSVSDVWSTHILTNLLLNFGRLARVSAKEVGKTGQLDGQLEQDFQVEFGTVTKYEGNMTKGAVISLFHGGGPMPLLNDPGHADVNRSFKTRVPSILHLTNPSLRPRAIIIVTAHWSTLVPTVSSSPTHSLCYDYSGFPPSTYNLSYPAPGSPEIAQEILSVLRSAGFDAKADPERGWDHGVFVPMMMVRPEADIPIIQLSVLTTNDPAQHFAYGRALASLRDSNIAIVGSGAASFHNLRAVFSGVMDHPEFLPLNKAWSKQLTDAMMTEDVEARGRKFGDWRQWEGSEVMQPKGGEEHFWPAVVCAGAAGEGVGRWYTDEWRGVDAVSYYWGGEIEGGEKI